MTVDIDRHVTRLEVPIKLAERWHDAESPASPACASWCQLVSGVEWRQLVPVGVGWCKHVTSPIVPHFSPVLRSSVYVCLLYVMNDEFVLLECILA